MNVYLNCQPVSLLNAGRSWEGNMNVYLKEP